MTNGDKKLIILFIVMSIIGFTALNISQLNDTSQYVVIKQEDKILKSVLLEKDDIYKFYFDENVGYIEVKNKRVRMLPMDKSICPNGICSETGWINNNYKSIVCLPNKLIVTLESNSNEDVDEISN